MKVAVVGTGAVGSATALSLVEHGGTCREIVLLDRDTARADGVAADLKTGGATDRSDLTLGPA
ncbi:lactate/malate family dehydrogenase [Streptomyces shenzhenensis]|uniref:lactate/malate family dehydrogenase n=1 Tax=Streptomyces shenzhenensis TaxID=943815 RepID=UPI003D8B9E6A